VSSAPIGYLEEILADGDNHHAFVIRRNSETIGLAELHLTGSRSGDVGLLVEDRFQGKGIGSLALRLLVCRARELGLGLLTADVQRETFPLSASLRRVGSTTVRQEHGVLHFELELIVAEPSRAATHPGAASSPLSDSDASTERDLAA
jgi:GNAT superfamily N-acetyltransferase